MGLRVIFVQVPVPTKCSQLLCDYCDSLSPKVRIWDFGLLFWTQSLDSELQASDLGLWTQACKLKTKEEDEVIGNKFRDTFI